jgi:flagellar hook-associated protein FlgK
MAERRGSRAVAAREKARARTAATREREQRLEDLATEWFELDGQIGDLRDAAEARIEQYTARINGELVQQVGQLEQRSADAAVEMLELTNASDVADRLAIPLARVREIKAAREAGGARDDAVAASTAAGPSEEGRASSVAP